MVSCIFPCRLSCQAVLLHPCYDGATATDLLAGVAADCSLCQGVPPQHSRHNWRVRVPSNQRSAAGEPKLFGMTMCYARATNNCKQKAPVTVCGRLASCWFKMLLSAIIMTMRSGKI